MNQTQTVEEYKSPDIRFFKIHTEQVLCSSGMNPRYDGFGNEEDL